MLASFLSGTRNQLRQINWMLLALRTWTLLNNVISATLGATKKTYGALTDAFSEEIYVFFKGDSTPYRVQHVVSEGPGIPSIDWTYNKTTKTFSSSAAAPHTSSKCLEWLSASIQYNGLNLYSLDELIEGTQVLHSQGTMPSNELLVAAWSLHSGVVLDKTIDLKLFVIHSSGKEETVSLWKKFQQQQTKVICGDGVAYRQQSLLDSLSSLVNEKVSGNLKNDYFPCTGLREDLPVETSDAILRTHEKTMDSAELERIVQAKKGTNTDVSGVPESGIFSKGVAEVDFEKVD